MPQLQPQDMANFFEFWKLYNYDIGKKFVRVAKRKLNSQSSFEGRKKRHSFRLFQKKIDFTNHQQRFENEGVCGTLVEGLNNQIFLVL